MTTIVRMSATPEARQAARDDYKERLNADPGYMRKRLSEKNNNNYANRKSHRQMELAREQYLETH
ncbi:MAG: hypothetical protein IMZ52_06500 [Actinobacteria bacterium]|nr:hypothetical protein [Actinomycetota bacterium]